MPSAILFGECGCCEDDCVPPERAVFAKHFFSGFCRFRPDGWGVYGPTEDPLTLLPDYYHHTRYLVRQTIIEWQAYNGETDTYDEFSRTVNVNLEPKNGRVSFITVSESCDVDPLYLWVMVDDGSVTETNHLPIGQGGDGTGTPCELEWDPGSAPVFNVQTVSGLTYINDQYYGDGSYPTADGKVHYKTTTRLSVPYTIATCLSDAEALLGEVTFSDPLFDALGQLYTFWPNDYNLADSANDSGEFNATGTISYPRSTADGSDLTAAQVNADGPPGWDIGVDVPTGWNDWLYGSCYGYACFPELCGDGVDKSGNRGSETGLKYGCPDPAAFKLLTQDAESLQWVLLKKSTASLALIGEACELHREMQLDSIGDTGNEWSGEEECSLISIDCPDTWGPGDVGYDWGVISLQKPDDTNSCCEGDTAFDACCEFTP